MIPQEPSLLIRPSEVEPFDRGQGIATLPMVGKWNSTQSSVTTGVTSFAPGTGIPLHSHNVDECVLVLEGEATVIIGDSEFDVDAGVNTWVPAGVPHRFVNRGNGLMRIFWIYGGLHVTRTITATGQTFEHLSEHDRQ
ncbi:cupin domain-containing protein [Kibdelosporangium philippinense]|uniref:Cupin domain-containing protein n=1 Tax=Kibdelosporangium philippinense TaxID=211113 RepID=A0ABS8ZA53_9PSEU|nr:cupin domain-containing protein [Kibdelosporangium philippinense]MCE7004756.1 cupin domain-containing protein [Kibdelosporangium philippinense]